MQQLEAINEKLDEAFNKHDATAVAAFYTANAILSSPLRIASGLSDIEEYFTNVFKHFSGSDHSIEINYVYSLVAIYVESEGGPQLLTAPASWRLFSLRGIDSMNATEVAQNNFNSWNRHDAGANVAAYAKGNRKR
jgi:hypothetical protein